MENSQRTTENAISPMHPQKKSSTFGLPEGFESSGSAGSNRRNTYRGATFTVASTLAELRHIIDNCPLIDNHAHPLLQKQDRDGADGPLLQVLSEANCDAMKDVRTTLAYHRALRTFKTGFPNYHSQGINDAWQSWRSYRDQLCEADLTEVCLDGLQTILLDDGLRCQPGQNSRDIDWHNQFLMSPAKRVVRLETLAEDLIHADLKFGEWEAKLKRSIQEAILDRDVVAFKTVICYRDGLQMQHLDMDMRPLAQRQYGELREDDMSMGPPRIRGCLNEWVLDIFAQVTEQRIHLAKPLQFHTGFGDSDLKLAKADPSFLQPFIEKHFRIPIVLLHASYPFTRQAGYLAMAYSNVYLDFGLIWPKLSQEGQESVVKQLLELTPSNKAMWSSDGAFYAETYYLAIQQTREVLKTVMAEIYSKGNVNLRDLSGIVTDLLFNTANKVYKLDLHLPIPPPSHPRPYRSSNHRMAGLPPPGAAESHRGLMGLKALRAHLEDHPDIEYIRLNWLDYSAILRTRILKLKHVIKQLEQNHDGSVIGVAKASLYLLSNCHIAAGGSPVGEWRLVPDFASFRVHPHKHAGEETYKHASMMCSIEDEDQSRIPICPRSILANTLDSANEAGLNDFKIGFEIEFCMFKQADLDGGELVPITSNHTWSTSRAFHTKALEILEEIDTRLSHAGIEIEQFHSEAARGQFELILAPLPPMLAVDTLIHTREVMQYVCAQHGYRASISPKPFDGECGSASHMHISFQPVDKQWSFFAGVLDEIRAVNALTLGSDMSYDRVLEGYWAGGLWACWGRQNREAPLRLVEEAKAHWEVKCVDGLANMYLAVAGVITAGTIGVVEGRKIYGEAEDVESTATEGERLRRGIKTRMTSSMAEALAELFEKDGTTPTAFAERLGPGVAKHVKAIKEAEKEFLLSRYDQDADPTAKRVWAAQWY
ncbi:hypothetical protein TWF696_008500 [Orbilia brochopaga]